MHIKRKVGPYFMNIFYIITFYNFANAKLQPCRYAHYEANIPIRRIFHNFIQLFGPLFFPGNFFAWFV